MNKDLKIAADILNKDGLTICVVNNDLVIYKSKENGIAPLYRAYDSGINFSGCSAADKVVGLGAAYFYKELKAKCIHANIISKSALDYLNKNHIDAEYSILVDRIMNREKNGFCPVESIAMESIVFDDFIKRVREFLSKINII